MKIVTFIVLNIQNVYFYNNILKNIDNIFTIDESFNIKSGSIAQVYLCYYKDNPDKRIGIMHTLHPEIEYQLYWIEKYNDFI